MMVYWYWTFPLLFEEKYCYKLLMDGLMLLYTMVVLTLGWTTSMMLLPLQQDHLTKTLINLQMAIVEQCSYFFSYLQSPFGIPAR